jgi:hypothetical protein
MFLPVCAVLFATFFAVLTGPASIVPMEMAMARMNENNAFIVLYCSFLTARMRLAGRHRESEVKTRSGRSDRENFRGWARQDSNLGPRDYESPALTAELQARLSLSKLVAAEFSTLRQYGAIVELVESLGEGHQAIATANSQTGKRAQNFFFWTEVASFASRQSKTRMP